jgi:hypothetical protein
LADPNQELLFSLYVEATLSSGGRAESLLHALYELSRPDRQTVADPRIAAATAAYFVELIDRERLYRARGAEAANRWSRLRDVPLVAAILDHLASTAPELYVALRAIAGQPIENRRALQNEITKARRGADSGTIQAEIAKMRAAAFIESSQKALASQQNSQMQNVALVANHGGHPQIEPSARLLAG